MLNIPVISHLFIKINLVDKEPAHSHYIYDVLSSTRLQTLTGKIATFVRSLLSIRCQRRNCAIMLFCGYPLIFRRYKKKEKMGGKEQENYIGFATA